MIERRIEEEERKIEKGERRIKDEELMIYKMKSRMTETGVGS
jgi:hypothetical protein